MDFSVPSGTKNTDEQQELQHYEENMKWVEDAKKDFNAWRSGVWKKVVTNHHLRVSCFYSPLGNSTWTTRNG